MAQRHQPLILQQFQNSVIECIDQRILREQRQPVMERVVTGGKGGKILLVRLAFLQDLLKRLDIGLGRHWTCLGKVESCFVSGRLPFVCSGADEVQRRVPPDRIVEAVDVTADGGFCVVPGHEDGSPDEFGF